MSARDTVANVQLSKTAEGGKRPFYGWIILPIATIGMVCTSPGQTYGVSPFNEYFREALNLSYSQLSGAYMAGTLLAALPMTYVGILIDRYGLRRCISVVVILFGLACVYIGTVNSLFALFIGFFLLRLLGQGAFGLMAGNMLAYWFHRKLGTVEGMRHAGIAVAIALIPALNLWLIHQFGWRMAYAILGAAVCAIMLPLMIVFRNRPEDVGQYQDGVSPDEGNTDPDGVTPESQHNFTLSETLRTRAFWIVAGLIGLWSMLGTALIFHVVPLFTERGLSEGEAALLFPTFAISLAVMQLIAGFLADRVPLNKLFVVAVAAMSAALASIWRADAVWMIFLTGFLMGATQGFLTSLASPLWPRYYGRSHLGRIRGVLATVMVAASSVGPFIMGAARDWAGSFTPVLGWFILLPLPFLVLGYLATPPAAPGHARGR